MVALSVELKGSRVNAFRPDTGDSIAAPEAPVIRLLLIEDDLIISSMMGDDLKELGYAVVGPASTIRQAIELATFANVDGALLDIEISEKFTGDVAAILAERDIPFFFVSGHDECPDPRYQDVPVLGKPFNFIQLRTMIERVLARTPATA